MVEEGKKDVSRRRRDCQLEQRKATRSRDHTQCLQLQSKLQRSTSAANNDNSRPVLSLNNEKLFSSGFPVHPARFIRELQTERGSRCLIMEAQVREPTV
ncbi:hypothetical protein BJ165DRAFT_1501961, partial [Panaeolus papilionaceus]